MTMKKIMAIITLNIIILNKNAYIRGLVFLAVCNLKTLDRNII